MLGTHLINRNGCVAGNLALQQGARRENILYGSVTDEQRCCSVEDRTTLRAEFWRAASGVAPQLQNPAAMLLRRALPAARQNSAHRVPIYEMGSKEILRSCALWIVTVVCAIAGAHSAAAQEPARMQPGVITTFAPIVEKVAPSVVTVFTTQTVSRGQSAFPFCDDTLRQFFGGQLPQRQGKQTLQGLGSGVIVSPDGYILTANHVVSGAEEIMVGLGTELRKYKAKKVGT